MPDAASLTVCAAGFIAAVMNSIAGGGTMLTFPALLGAGLPGVLANTTSTVALFIGMPGSIWAFRKQMAGLGPWLWPLGIISLLGGLAGGMLLLAMPPGVFDAVVPWLLILATFLFVANGPLQRWLRGKTLAAEEPERPARWGLAFQSVVAVYGGYFGAGIGIMMLAGLSLLGLHRINRMNAIKAVLASLVNLASVVYFIVKGQVHWPLALWLMGGSIPGYFVGGHLAQKIPGSWVRTIVAVIGFGIAVSLLIRRHA